MSIEAVAWALNVGPQDDDPTAMDATRKLVLIGYANHAHSDGSMAMPGLKRVARYACCSGRTAQRARDWLAEHGYLREADERSQAAGRSKVDDPRHAPVVYDLAMTEERRRQWEAEYAGASERRAKAAAHGALGRASRVDTVAPPGEGRGDNLTPPARAVRGDSGSPQGVTDDLSRGDTAMSPEPSLEPSLEPPLQDRSPQPVDDAVKDGGGGALVGDTTRMADDARLLLDPRLRGRTEKQRETIRTALCRALEAGPWGTAVELAEAVNARLHPGEVRAPVGLLPSLIEAAREKHAPPVPQRRRREPCTTERNGHTWPGDGPCPMCREAGVA